MDKAKTSDNLEEMMDDLAECRSLYRPSNFWRLLNKDHIQKITTSGFSNFKRSVNLRYFSWGLFGILVQGLNPLILSILKGNLLPFSKGKFKNYNNYFNNLTAYLYKTYVCSLYDYVKRFDKRNIFKKLNEPSVGNPFTITYKGKEISQDLCNSVHEFNTIANSTDLGSINNVAELGAGYGRTAYVFLKVLPHVKYTDIDIPPALYIAQKYLSKIFNRQKIFYYRRFKKFSDVKKEFEAAKIRFLMSDQIELIPKKYFDLVINTSSLHEMRRNQINNYIKQINGVGKGYFYTKQWHRSLTADNDHIMQHEYPIPKNWATIFSRYPHPIQGWFFDALYKIN